MFGKDKTTRSGLRSWCKKCRSKKSKEYRKNFRAKYGYKERPGGFSYPYSKLEHADIPLIKQLAESLSINEIADKFEVGYQCIYNIIKGKTWVKPYTYYTKQYNEPANI
jgi:DNA invertase Pin-like site-specific DNA recombinase